MKLAILSHTQHYKTSQGTVVGWGPTVAEINHLIKIFDEIYHIAVLTDETAPQSALAYSSNKIHFIPLKKVGGKKITDKFNVLLQIPKVISAVNTTLKKVDVFQFRAPTGMGVYLIPYLSLFSNKKGWFKYAGNWKEENPALGFRLQRFLLKNQARKVTINGEWEKQPKQCLSFENPCLTEGNRKEGKLTLQKKNKREKINYCFVGTFYERKGISKILEALCKIDPTKIGAFYFVGAGGMIEKYKTSASQIDLNIEFTGFLSKKEIHEIYKKSHYIVLPSENEGFPKVIGEAMNYGCIPIVSAVSCIGQYIKEGENGFLINPNTSIKLAEILTTSLDLSNSRFQEMISCNHKLAEKFTYAYYNEQIKNRILDFE